MSKVLIIDYGHGPKTQGKHSPDKSFYEYKFNRILGERIYNRLTGMGYKVVRTVTPDENCGNDLTMRVNRTKQYCAKYGTKNCIFISIHANAAGNATSWMNARGWSVFVGKNGSQTSKDLASALFDAHKAEGFKMRQPLPTQKYWQENFTVIYGAPCPSVLTESLFYDNKADLAILKSEEGIQKLVNAHCNAIVKFL